MLPRFTSFSNFHLIVTNSTYGSKIAATSLIGMSFVFAFASLRDLLYVQASVGLDSLHE